MLEMAGRTVGQGDVGKPILPIVDHPEEIDPAISGD
jgi:quinolinate synthase